MLMLIMLSENDIKEEISYAYVHAIASMVGFGCDRPFKDRDSIDVDVSSNGYLVPESKIQSAKIDLQVKATERMSLDSLKDRYAFPLKLGNYDQLRGRYMVPKFLVVLLLPEVPSTWLEHTETMLSLKNCAYWVSLYGAPASQNTTNQTVYIPRSNIFNPQSLWKLMTRVSCGEDIPYES